MNKQILSITILLLSFILPIKIKAQTVNKQSEANNTFKTAERKYSNKEYNAATTLFSKASESYLATGDTLNYVSSLAKQALSEFNLSNFQKASSLANKANDIWKTSKRNNSEHLIKIQFFQDLSTIYIRLFDHLNDAQGYLESALTLCEKENCEITRKAKLTTNLATTLYYQRKLIEAEKKYISSIGIIRGNSDSNPELMKASLMGLVSVQNEQGKFLKTQETYQALEKLISSNNNYQEKAWLYSSKSSHLYFQGLFKEAISYANQAITIQNQLPKTNQLEIIKFRHTKGEAFKHLSIYDSAIALFKKNVLQESQLLGLNHPNLIYSYNSLGDSYLFQDLDSSVIFYKKALELVKKTVPESSHQYSVSLENLGKASVRNKEFRNGIALLHKSDSIRAILYGLKGSRRLETLYEIAQSYYAWGQTSSALKTLKTLDSLNRVNNESTNFIFKYASPLTQIRTTKLMLTISLDAYSSTNDPVKLKESEALFKKLKTHMIELNSNYSTFGNKELAWEVFSEGFNQYLTLRYNDSNLFKDLLAIVEDLKFRPLIDRINQKIQLEQGLFNESRTTELQEKIRSLLSEMVSNNNDSIKNQLFLAQEEYNSILSSLNTEAQLFSISNITNQLQGKNHISYYKTNEHLFVFGSSKDQKEIYKITIDTIKSDLDSFVTEIETPSPNGIKIISKTGNKLFSHLLPFEWIDQVKRIQFSTHILTNDLYFDALLSSPASSENLSFKDLPFLIKSHETSFTPSLAINSTYRPDKQEEITNLFTSNSTHTGSNLSSPLPSAAREVKEIKKILNSSESHVDSKKDSTFFKKLSRARVNHFATHAFVNQKTPELSYIELSRDPLIPETSRRLYSFEIANSFDINAEIIFLSACETGKVISKNSKMGFNNSLAASFLMAGANIVIASKNNTNDFANSKIAIKLYESLEEGSSPASALREAKISYLNSSPEIFAHPSYWAQLELMQIEIKKKESNAIIFSIAILTLLSLFFIVKFRR